ncbi:tetratricopeptide repeat-containing diguanylate cyclase [Cellulomonas sp. KRMCY2]|uniref:tetratricopeptide repeat-containing diguanylate cyclase n=1 Tax=Cellulomonas sp. KRMCY2 TaxID=1304865 RepID=UPI00045EB01D|nr:tetratricopeptide repeat-containing diguanylate cyclase [Cellulomonas sp. KRMCY2]
MSAVVEHTLPAVSTVAPDWDALVEEMEFLRDSDARACVRRSVEAITLARALADEDAEMRLSYFAAFAHHLLGEDGPALEAAGRTEHLARERGELVWQSRALACRGLVHHEVGDIEDAVDLLVRALDLRQEAGDVLGTAEILNNLGTVYTGMRQFAPQAARVLTDARRLWLTAGDTDHASIALTGLAKAYVATSGYLAETNPRGALTAARHALGIAQQAVEESDAAGLSRTGVDARLAVVGAHLVANDLDAAGTVLEATRAMLARFPTARQQLTLHRVRAGWLVRTGRHDEAVLEVCDGLDLCEELARPGERLELLRTLVAAHEGCGDPIAALRTLHEVYDLTIQQSRAVAERRAVLLSSRLEVERAERIAAAERRRSLALEQHNTRLTHEATHDALTGLPNRRALDTALAQWVGDHPGPFAFALVDIDHFKHVNDHWSHQVGDHVLTRLGSLLGEAVRSSDLAARYGGEEFGLLLDAPDATVAHDTCERIRAAVAALDWADLIPGSGLTVSIGLTMGASGCSVDALLGRADRALYEAKAQGRDQVRLNL